MVRISDHPHKMFEKSLHRRNDSEEIDVFEAAKYFSGTNEIYPNTKDRQCSKAGGHGISLDMSMRKATQTVPVVKENQSKEKKHKQKQPSSPGGRIAKILNALFNQTSLKKGKPKTSWSSKSVKDDEDSTPSDWRRKRRSSISNFQHIEEHKSSQSFNSGFRTPPAYPQTPKASSSFKDFRSYSDHKEISPYAFKNHRSQIPSLISIGLIKGENLKHGRHGKNGFARRFDVEDDRYSPPPPAEEEEEEREFTKFSEADGGAADSDSSSDLFDLPNCDRNLYSSELPVYESTHIQSIKTTTR